MFEFYSVYRKSTRRTRQPELSDRLEEAHGRDGAVRVGDYGDVLEAAEYARAPPICYRHDGEQLVPFCGSLLGPKSTPTIPGALRYRDSKIIFIYSFMVFTGFRPAPSFAAAPAEWNRLFKTCHGVEAVACHGVGPCLPLANTPHHLTTSPPHHLFCSS